MLLTIPACLIVVTLRLIWLKQVVNLRRKGGGLDRISGEILEPTVAEKGIALYYLRDGRRCSITAVQAGSR